MPEAGVFRVDGNGLQGGLMRRGVTLAGVVALAVTACAYLIGSVSGNTLLWTMLYVLICGSVLAIGYPWSRCGTAIIDERGLRVSRRVGVEVYRWEDIDSLRVGSFGEQGGLDARVAWMAGIPATLPVVVARLARPLKYGLPGRSGSDVTGLAIGARTVYFLVDNPDDFLSAATRVMHRSAPPPTAAATR